MRAYPLQPPKPRAPPLLPSREPVRNPPQPPQSSHGGASLPNTPLSTVNGSRCSIDKHGEYTRQCTIIDKSGKRSEQNYHIPKTGRTNAFSYSSYKRTRLSPIAHRRLQTIVKVFSNNRSISPTKYCRGQISHNQTELPKAQSLYSAEHFIDIFEERDEVITIIFRNSFINTPNAKIVYQTNSSRTLLFLNIDRKFRDLHSDRYTKYSGKNVSSSVNHLKTLCLFPLFPVDVKKLRDRHNYGAFSKSGKDIKEDKDFILSVNICDTPNRFVHKRRMKNSTQDFQITYLNSENGVLRTRNVFLCLFQRKHQINEINNFNISKNSSTGVFSHGDIHTNIAVNLLNDIAKQDDRDRPPEVPGGTDGSIQISCDISDRLARYSGVSKYENTKSRISGKTSDSMDEWRKDHRRRYHQDGRKKDRGHRRPWYRRWSGWWALLLSLSMTVCAGGTSLPLHKYSTRVVRTKYGPLRGIIVHAHPPVEAFLGVPYATPPLGSLRYMPPVTPSQWRNTRLADRFAPACPQLPPTLPAHQEALLQHPRARVAHLEKLLPLLKNFSEDCLYLNLYVPKIGENMSLPCLVYVHGESYEWNSGNPYDGTVLASQGHLIVVTINFRLGILGFLKTGAKSSAQGNFGLMDLVAGLHWLRENLPAFGGDPDRVTLMGHGTGAALTNFIAVSPVARELLQRVILFSGSGLSSWALQREPLTVKKKVAEQTGCHGDLLEDDIAPCLRTKSLNELLAVRIDPPRFLPGFAPFVDGTVLLNPSQVQPPSFNVAQNPSSASTVATAAGYELADFPDRTLLFGLTSTESYLDLSAQDLEFGFNETRRDRILRTYVRNAYYFHLNEIFSTLKNEYTDWDRPVQNPLNVRDATLEVLSDGHTAAPLIRLGYLHAMRGGKTFFAHFQHLSSDRDFPQRSGSVHGEDIPYCFGLPLVGGQPFFPHNYTTQDQATSKTLIEYITNFAKSGDPNSPTAPSDSAPAPASAPAAPEQEEPPSAPLPFWDTYDTINQLYLEIGSKPEMRSHYRGHKMSLWLSLIPQLHRPGEPGLQDTSMRHHHFLEEGAHYYEGSVRPQSMQRPNLPHLVAPSVAPAKPVTAAPAPPVPSVPPQPVLAPTTECPPNATLNSRNIHKDNNNLLRKLASSHYQSYTTALTVTIAVGCFLLLLNILIFAGIYHQRDRNNGSFGDKKKEELAEAGSCSTSSGGDNYDAKTLNFETQGQSYEGNKSGYNFDCKAGSYQMKSGSKYDLRTFPPECGKTAFGEYSCYDEKNLAAQYEKRSLADITLCSVPDGVDIPMQEFRNSPSKRCDNGSSIVKIDTQKPDIQRINNQGIRSLENQTSSFHENGSRLSLTSVHDRHSRTTTFGEPVKVTDSSTQVKFSSSGQGQGQGEGKQTTFGPDGPCEEDLASSTCSDESAFKAKEKTVSVGNQSDPTTCDVGTGIDRSPSIPEAPPPPKGGPPATGILRQTNPTNPTAGIMKKRVQIQEISV